MNPWLMYTGKFPCPVRCYGNLYLAPDAVRLSELVMALARGDLAAARLFFVAPVKMVKLWRRSGQMAQWIAKYELGQTALLKQEQAWQPIETCPDDGTWFLGYLDGEYSVVRTWKSWAPDDWTPTHWMPLPPPPVEQEKGTTTP